MGFRLVPIFWTLNDVERQCRTTLSYIVFFPELAVYNSMKIDLHYKQQTWQFVGDQSDRGL